MTVSLLEILVAARSHVAPLAAESAGYLLLAVADHLALSPRAMVPDDVELQTDGSVRLRGRGAATSNEVAEQAARRLLARTLEVASSVGPGLRRAAERREATGLEGLVRELEVALIPVNRSAARRALARLHRETERARDQGKLEALLRAEQQEVVPAADPIALGADFLEAMSATPAPALPVVAVAVERPAAKVVLPPPVPTPAPVVVAVLEPTPARAYKPAKPVPLPELVLSPPPPPEEPAALTKPEPVVERARERGSSTPRLGTLVTAQTMPGEEADLTDRAPSVALIDDADELDVPIEVVLEADEPQALLDPSPSRLPDVLTAMLELHTGVQADEAPTRMRDVITELRPPALTPEPETVDDAWLTQSSLEDVVSAPKLEPVEIYDASVHDAVTFNPGEVAPRVDVVSVPLVTPAPVFVIPATTFVTPAPVFVIPATTFVTPAPVAVTPAPVAVTPAPLVMTERLPEVVVPWEPEPLAVALLISEPAPEPSPYAPAVLPGRQSDVSELLDSFHVSDAAEERELRGALKEMAGLDLTPMPHPFAQAK